MMVPGVEPDPTVAASRRLPRMTPVAPAGTLNRQSGGERDVLNEFLRPHSRVLQVREK